MNVVRTRCGYLRGFPCATSGSGGRPLVVFQGLFLENKPSRYLAFGYRSLTATHTIYALLRRPGLPHGCSLRQMSDDYATFVREQFGGPVDVLGVSTGGSIAQHFAADHPDLVDRLVLHSAAHRLSDAARRLQLRLRDAALRGRWTEANALLLDAVLPRSGAMRFLRGGAVRAGARLMALNAPGDPSDLVATIEAEDQHAFRDRLGEITAPTLVVAGDQDPFYTPALFRETAEGIPGARLILYPGMGHPARGGRFARDVQTFLDGGPERERRQG